MSDFLLGRVLSTQFHEVIVDERSLGRGAVIKAVNITACIGGLLILEQMLLLA
jgi:hypothetical protein